MSPTIRVDDEVFKELQRQAQPFVDSPNDVLRRVLGLNHSHRRSVRRPRAPAGSVTPEREYRPLILKALVKRAGSAPRREVLKSVKEALNGRFKPRDLEHTFSGPFVWETWASWERKNMVDDGLLKPDSQRGIWELTPSGRIEAGKLLSSP